MVLRLSRRRIAIVGLSQLGIIVTGVGGVMERLDALSLSLPDRVLCILAGLVLAPLTAAVAYWCSLESLFVFRSY